VEAGGVVEGFDVIEDASLGVSGGGDGEVMKTLGFERGEEAFESGVIVGIGGAAHTGDEAVRVKELTVLSAGILAAAITVMKQAWSGATLEQSHLQSGHRESGWRVGSKGQADDAADAKIEDNGQVEPAIGGG